MADRSKVVLTERENEHRSRLVKSLQSLNDLKYYTTKPTGVWGSTALIRCGNVKINSYKIDFEFTIPFDDDLEANEGEIIIYNLSDNTIKQLKVKSKLTIEAGYTGDTGVIFTGYITKKTTKKNGVDKVTTLKVIDDIEEKKNIELTYSAPVTAKYILNDLLRRVSLPVGKISLVRDWTYDNDVKIDESLESAIKKYAEVCGVSAFVTHGKLYCCELNNTPTDYGYFVVTETTGMIGSPSQFEETRTAEDYEDTIEGYEIEMLLQHRMFTGAKIQLSSDLAKGYFYVKSGEHIFNESECITKVKAV